MVITRRQRQNSQGLANEVSSACSPIPGHRRSDRGNGFSHNTIVLPALHTYSSTLLGAKCLKRRAHNRHQTEPCQFSPFNMHCTWCAISLTHAHTLVFFTPYLTTFHKTREYANHLRQKPFDMLRGQDMVKGSHK